jgi:hypothetical protein
LVGRFVFFALLVLFSFAILCCGGLFATTSTARSKLSHAPGISSGSLLAPLTTDRLAMTDQPYNPMPLTKDMIGYWLGLGIFVHQFAHVEMTLWITLAKLSGVGFQRARAVFHGVRSDAARSYINRILETTNAEQSVRDDFQFIFTQLGYLTDARNSILHSGTTFNTEDGDFLSTNAMLALTDDRRKEFPVSQIILNQMVEDLKKINAHLLSFLFVGAPPGIKSLNNLDEHKQRAWQYKPPPQASPGGKPRNKTQS